jgi:hypothetical protein
VQCSKPTSNGVAGRKKPALWRPAHSKAGHVAFSEIVKSSDYHIVRPTVLIRFERVGRDSIIVISALEDCIIHSSVWEGQVHGIRLHGDY